MLLGLVGDTQDGGPAQTKTTNKRVLSRQLCRADCRVTRGEALWPSRRAVGVEVEQQLPFDCDCELCRVSERASLTGYDGSFVMDDGYLPTYLPTCLPTYLPTLLRPSLLTSWCMYVCMYASPDIAADLHPCICKTTTTGDSQLVHVNYQDTYSEVSGRNSMIRGCGATCIPNVDRFTLLKRYVGTLYLVSTERKQLLGESIS